VGIGWEAGLTSALMKEGVALADAELIVGSSAGSVVGATIARGGDPADRLARYREASPDAAKTAASDIGARMGNLMQAMAAAAEAPPDDRLKTIGRFVLEADTPPEEEFLDGFDDLDGVVWPDGFVCTAVDAETGEFIVWDQASDVDLLHAVASSCAVPCVFPPITINGRRYFDGGMRSITNADLAKGHERVLIVSVFEAPADSTDPRAVRMRRTMETEFGAIREGGGTHEWVAPDDEAKAVIGINVMDPTKAVEAFEAGVAQAGRIVERLSAFWR
jgi:NTE family protein